jgi:hypothetical protein
MRRTILPFLAAVLILWGLVSPGCTSRRAPQPSVSPGAPSAVAPTRITSKKTARTFAYVRVADPDSEIEKFELPPGGLAAASPDNFHGTDRKAAKISISDGSTQTFSDLAALLDSSLFLPDDQMVNHDPPIPKTANSGRVEEEQHNVVVTAFLYASAKEPDNDFHCIVGTEPGQPPRFLNVEVTGLPLSGPFRAQLKTVRDKFKEFFGQDLPGKGYSKFDPPIPVRISGSLFFDVDHPAGAVGPTGLKPTTAWEIHPVTDIEFEP